MKFNSADGGIPMRRSSSGFRGCPVKCWKREVWVRKLHKIPPLTMYSEKTPKTIRLCDRKSATRGVVSGLG